MSLVPYHDNYSCTDRQLKDAKNLVLLHGWGTHSGVWDEVMPDLLRQFNVTVIDLPGLGRSPLPNSSYNLANLCEQILLVAPDKSVWLGWSLGGLVALKIAAEYPERVIGLVNVASAPKYCRGENDWPQGLLEQSFDELMNLVVEDWQGALIQFLALQCRDSELYGQDVGKLQELIFFYGQPAKKALTQGLVILRDEDLRSELQALKQPILYLLGEKDNVISSGMANSIESLNRNCRVVLVRGASHVPFLSHPKQFLRAFNDFVSMQLT